jgi:predicted RNA-binding Zn ribbon-like protein
MYRSRAPAPPLEAPRLLVDLLATRAAANRDEQLPDPPSATAWLADQDLMPPDPELTQAEWQRLVELREGLYALLLAPMKQWTEDAARLFNQAIRDAPFEVSVTSRRTVRIASPDRTFAGAIGKIASLVVNCYFAGQWKRFKVCANDECRRVFYDDSRSGVRRWCGRRCGDKIRARSHRSAVKHGRR